MTGRRVNGIQLNVVEQGERGRLALIFLHYFGGSSREWEGAINSLSGSFHCVAYDARGSGESDKPETGYSVAEQADDLAGVIAELELTRYIVVGHSMGGKAAMQFAARQPAGLQALLLVAPSPPTPEPMTEADRQHSLTSHGTREAALETLHKITHTPPNEEATARFVEDNLRVGPAAWTAWLESGSRENIADQMGRIGVSTHLLGGQFDPVIAPDVLREEVQARLPGATLEIVPNSGHLIPYEVMEQLTAFITTHLAQLK